MAEADFRISSGLCDALVRSDNNPPLNLLLDLLWNLSVTCVEAAKGITANTDPLAEYGHGFPSK